MRARTLRSRTIRALVAATIATATLAGTAGSVRAQVASGGGGDDDGAATSIAVIIDPLRTTIDAVNAAVGTTTLDGVGGPASAYLLAPPTGTTIPATIKKLNKVRGVVEAEGNEDAESPEFTGSRMYRWAGSDPQSTEDQYADTKLGLEAAHAISTGSGTTVAIVDTGIQLLPSPHPDLAAVTDPGIDFVDGDNVPDDSQNGIDDNHDGNIDEGAGHGTFIAGIIHRVAPAAHILPIRALDSEGEGSEWDVAKGMFWAADHGADVVNISAGRHGGASLLIHAVDVLENLGVVTVVAAGNDGRDRNERPAEADCALAVTGSGSTDKVSKFSTLGDWVDVGAPAETIHSTFPFFASGYASWNGTSFAAPFASGQVALLLSLNPALKVGDVLAYVKGTTVKYKGAHDEAGFGRIAPTASLVALQNGTRPSPKKFDVDNECFRTD